MTKRKDKVELEADPKPPMPEPGPEGEDEDEEEDENTNIKKLNTGLINRHDIMRAAGQTYLAPNDLAEGIAQFVFAWIKKYNVQPDWRRVRVAVLTAEQVVKRNWAREVRRLNEMKKAA